MGINNIEYQQHYAHIELEGELIGAQFINELNDKILEVAAEEDRHIVIGLKHVENVSLDVCHYFESIHHQLYDKGISIVFAEMNENVLKKFKQEQLHIVLNLTPTIIEAYDIINMDILERDILNEE